MYFGIMLLLLLAGSVLLGVIRKLRGGTFFPSPEPGEDAYVKDKRGRWWRYDGQTGDLEEAFRRPPGEPDLKPVFKGTVYFYCQLFAWMAPLAVLGLAVSALSDAAGRAGIPAWVPWVAAGVIYLALLRLARRRGWLPTAEVYNAKPDWLAQRKNR
jgi:hypothetical protein